MPLDPALRRDLPLYALLTAVFTLPLVASLQPNSALRLQARDLARTVVAAVIAAAQVSAAVVVGGGALLYGERLWWRVRAWLAHRRGVTDGDA
ncbi:hypothetical protein JCM3770_000370 [Rhodotorula araucariae]